MGLNEIRDSAVRALYRLRTLVDPLRLCDRGDDEHLDLIARLIKLSDADDVFGWLLTNAGSFVARASLEHAVRMLDAELVRPVAKSLNPVPPPFGVYFTIPEEDDLEFPYLNASIGPGGTAPVETIRRAVRVLLSYVEFASERWVEADALRQMWSDVLRLTPEADPVEWVLQHHPNVASVDALAQLLSVCALSDISQ